MTALEKFPEGTKLTALDLYLQRYRIGMAGRFIAPGSRVLDIGSYDGALFSTLKHLRNGCGIDPQANPSVAPPNAVLVRGYFPQALPPDSPPFDVITMLAVLEHIQPDVQAVLARDCFAHLRPGGRLIITVPSPLVDQILFVLQKLRLVKGIAVEQHYGYDATQTPSLFGAAGFTLFRSRRFQLGLNNLFVFERPAA